MAKITTLLAALALALITTACTAEPTTPATSTTVNVTESVGVTDSVSVTVNAADAGVAAAATTVGVTQTDFETLIVKVSGMT